MEQSCLIFVLCVALPFQTVRGVPGLFFERKYEDSSSRVSPDLTGESSDLYLNSSVIQISSEIPTSESFPQTDPSSNSTSTLGDGSLLLENSTDSQIGSLDTHEVATLTEIFGNQSQSSSPSSKSTSGAGGGGGTVSTHSTTTASSSSSSSTQGVDGSVTDDDDDEPENVARGKPPGTESVNVTVPETESLYQKTLALISDTYTLSILVPVAAGIIFASTILIMIAICGCARRQCRRRRLRKKVLPDSVKNLRPSDRARLLAESSDEEF